MPASPVWMRKYSNSCERTSTGASSRSDTTSLRPAPIQRSSNRPTTRIPERSCERSAFELDDGKARAEIGNVAQRVAIDEDVGGVQHDGPVRPWVHPFRGPL